MITRNEPKLGVSTDTFTSEALPAKPTREKRTFNKLFLIQQHIWIPIFPVEPTLDLPHDPNGP
jgi:hypothetical protein